MGASADHGRSGQGFGVAHRVGVSSPPVSLSCCTSTAKLSARSLAAPAPPAAASSSMAWSADAGGAGAVSGGAATAASTPRRRLSASRLTLRPSAGSGLRYLSLWWGLPLIACRLLRKRFRQQDVQTAVQQP